MAHLDENELIKLYFSRDEKALSETQRQFGGLLGRLVMGILRCEQDCEECLSDVYFKLWSTIPPLKPDSFKAYAVKIARNEALMKLRRKNARKRDPSLEISLNELEDILPDKDIPDGSEHEIRDIINDFLEDLNADSRIIFIRKYWYFDSLSEISKRFGFSESKIKSSLCASRKKLKKRLKKEGVVL